MSGFLASTQSTKAAEGRSLRDRTFDCSFTEIIGGEALEVNPQLQICQLESLGERLEEVVAVEE